MWTWIKRRLFWVGKIRYIWGSPRIIGNLGCLLPADCWDERETSSLRFRVHKQRYTGWKWVFVETLELSHKEILLLGQQPIA